MPGSPLIRLGLLTKKITMIAQNLQKKEAKPLQDKSPLLVELHHYYKLTTNILYHRTQSTSSRLRVNIWTQFLLSAKLGGGAGWANQKKAPRRRSRAQTDDARQARGAGCGAPRRRRTADGKDGEHRKGVFYLNTGRAFIAEKEKEQKMPGALATDLVFATVRKHNLLVPEGKRTAFKRACPKSPELSSITFLKFWLWGFLG